MDKAYGAVDVPDSVIDLLTGVRNYLQARLLRCWLVGWRDGRGWWPHCHAQRCPLWQTAVAF